MPRFSMLHEVRLRERVEDVLLRRRECLPEEMTLPIIVACIPLAAPTTLL